MTANRVREGNRFDRRNPTRSRPAGGGRASRPTAGTLGSCGIIEGMKREDNCVRTVNGRVEAQQVKAFLEAHDIPSEIRGESVGAIYGYTLDGLGAVRILVPSSLVDAALDLLARVDRGELELPDEPDIEPAAGP